MVTMILFVQMSSDLRRKTLQYYKVFRRFVDEARRSDRITFLLLQRLMFVGRTWPGEGGLTAVRNRAKPQFLAAGAKINSIEEADKQYKKLEYECGVCVLCFACLWERTLSGRFFLSIMLDRVRLFVCPIHSFIPFICSSPKLHYQ